MNFEELKKKVAEAQLGTARMTDVTLGTYTLKIDGDVVSLVAIKGGQKFPVTETALAAMRIVKSEADAKTAKDTRDARTNDKYSNLQKTLAAENISLDENTKFNAVHRLPIHDAIADAPVLRNEHYKGYPAYLKAARAANAMPNVTDEQKTARRNAFTEATEALRASGVKSGVSINDSNCQCLPVFTIG